MSLAFSLDELQPADGDGDPDGNQKGASEDPKGLFYALRYTRRAFRMCALTCRGDLQWLPRNELHH